MTDKEIKKIIRQLKKHELSIREVPDEVKHHKGYSLKQMSPNNNLVL